jgi:hypothetical protein
MLLVRISANTSAGFDSRGYVGSVVEFAGDGVEVGLVVCDVDAFGCLCVCQAAGWGVVESCLAGSGSDLSEELVVGVEPAALDFRVAPRCPPGPRRKGKWQTRAEAILYITSLSAEETIPQDLLMRLPETRPV